MAWSKQQESGVGMWSFEGATGPEHWADLDPLYVVAAQGTRQSPIELEPASRSTDVEISFRYGLLETTVDVEGPLPIFNVSDGAAILVDGRRAALESFHVHVPAEHSVNGEVADGELHLVHRLSDDALVVVGVMVSTHGAPSGFPIDLDDVLTARGRDAFNRQLVDLRSLLPSRSRTVYRYDGSRTMPPCTEDVTWFVLGDAVSVGSRRVGRYFETYSGTVRPLQPRNGRFVGRSSV